MRRWLVLLLVAAVAQLSGQAPQQGPVAFKVASVKPNMSGQAAGSQVFQPGGRFTATNTPLENVIATAFGVSGRSLPTYQIVGAPDWAMSERFDRPTAPDSTASTAVLAHSAPAA